MGKQSQESCAYISRLSVAVFMCLCLCHAYADVVVRTSTELRVQLSRDADLGVIWLDGDEFEIDRMTVKAGGTVRPYGSRKPVFVGRRITLSHRCGRHQHLDDFMPQDFVVTNASLDLVPVSSHTISIGSAQIEKLDSASRSIRIDLQGQMPSSLRGKRQDVLSRCTLKLSFWFLCMSVTGLSADDRYVYGTLDTDYNYGKLGEKYSDFATLCFFNVPASGDAFWIDSTNVAHMPDGADDLTLRLCSRGMTLYGKRRLTFEDVAFVGLSEPVTIKSLAGFDKSFRRCTFRHCGRGIYCDNGLRNVPANIVVTDCTFTDMYGSECVYLCGCDNTVIAGNTTHRTGWLNKGGAVLTVAGDNVHVHGNSLSAMSYIGIRIGNTRLAGRIRNAGTVERNHIDNREYMGHPEHCLTDGGGIYVYTHQDATVVRDNVICNMGFPKGDVRGIFMDDGAYNTTVNGNLIYNILGSYCIDSRMVAKMADNDIMHYNSNNCFSHNVCLGISRMHGHGDDSMTVTTVSDNYVTSEGIKMDKGQVREEGTQIIDAVTTDNGIVVSRKTYRHLKRSLSDYVMQHVSK